MHGEHNLSTTNTESVRCAPISLQLETLFISQKSKRERCFHNPNIPQRHHYIKLLTCQVGELYRNDPAFDVARLVTELVEAESVPLLPVLRYKDSGLRKRREWEQTWDLQRQEDAIDARTKLRKTIPSI